MSAGAVFRKNLKEESPLQIIGAVNAYIALMAKRRGFKALYVSGAGVANYSYGLPDLGMTSLDNVLEDVRRVTAAVDLPVLVDIDTGWGSALGVARTIKEMIRAGAAAAHIEDQLAMKRCGHRPGKALVSTQEMCDRVKAAVDAKTDAAFVVMARSDALASEGLEALIDRACAYVEAGADMIFAEALTELEQYRVIKEAVGVPILANSTEFGKTPLVPIEGFAAVGVDMILYPLSPARAMARAAAQVLETIRSEGNQENCLSQMQTREELYQELDYYNYEAMIDRLFQKGSET